MPTNRNISWIPAWVDVSQLETFNANIINDQGGQPWRCTRPLNDRWGVIADGLRESTAALRAMPIAQIVETIDKVTAKWCDHNWSVRQAARAVVVEATGFSPEVVDRSFDVELKNYRADSLWRVLYRELGDAAALDGFVADARLPGRTFAIGPELTLAIFTGNVPGLPALSMVRALLAKSAVIAKVASGEPTFAARFAASLAEEDARIGDALLVTYWERHERDLLKTVLAQAEAVIAYGSIEACRSVRELARNNRIYMEHGHKFSAGLLGRDYLARVGAPVIAGRIAEDVGTFNQHACIAPQVYFVEGDSAAVHKLGDELSRAMQAYAEKYPLGNLRLKDAQTLQLQRAAQAWKATVADADSGLWQDSALNWTIAIEKDLAEHSLSGNRYIGLIPVDSLEQALKALRPYGEFLQNLALGADEPELSVMARRAALLGASRICRPGRMAEPSMIWHHDGQLCVAGLLRWCDIEMHDALHEQEEQ
ncbi:acyl-CoA reductase [Methylobacter sp.]|uniref:acyl-CoA reductase n=1 Tax=Methylobacter sp. TaxID=2051955 RepID=UPI003DA5C5AD